MWSTGCVIYFILIGQKPFENGNVAKLNKKIEKGDFTKSDPQWLNLSPKAKDLIEQLIEVDPIKRLSAVDAL